MNNLQFSEKEKISADSQLATLIEWAKPNSAESQRLALDASKLLASTDKRLEEIRNQGFFKRFWSKITGKLGELSQANQADLIQMQKFAWHYLVRLQEQNLIKAQSIVIIRNNLKNIALAELEIRQAIEILVDRFDSRISVLEWKSTLNVYEYEKYPEIHRVLKMVFDFYAMISHHNTSFKESTILKSALIEMGISKQKEVKISEFFESLLLEIYNQGPDLFFKTVKIDVDGVLLEPDYITGNISENIYSTLFYIYANIINSYKTTQDIQDDDEKKDAFLKSAMPSFADTDTQYRLIDLAEEILACNFLIEELYREQNKLVNCPVKDPDNAELSIDAMLAQHVSVSYHAFAETGAAPDECLLYLNSLSLIIASSGNISEKQQQYISTIAATLRVEDFSVTGFKDLVSHPNRIDMERVLALLSTRDRQFAWLMDAVFLGTLSGNYISENIHQSVIFMAEALNLKQDETETFISHAITVSTEKDQNLLFLAAKGIYSDTFSWKTIFDFRKVSIEDCFKTLRDKLSALGNENHRIADELENEFSFFSKNSIANKHVECISMIWKWKQRIESHESTFKNCLSETISIMRVFGTPVLSYQGCLDDIFIDKTEIELIIGLIKIKKFSNKNYNMSSLCGLAALALPLAFAKKIFLI